MANRIEIRTGEGIQISITAPKSFKGDFFGKNLLREAILELLHSYSDFNSSMIENGDTRFMLEGLHEIRHVCDESINDIPW